MRYEKKNMFHFLRCPLAFCGHDVLTVFVKSNSLTNLKARVESAPCGGVTIQEMWVLP